MIDFHCHLDLYKNPIDVFNNVQQRNTEVLAVTTSPRAYLKALHYFGTRDNVHIALGFHPELVAKRTNEIDLFMEQIPKCNYIGEIGIDGTGRNRASYEIQKKFFCEALSEAERHQGRIISIHSRGAVGDVLECIEKTTKKNIPVLHWFTGNRKELQKAISLGCWFSINPKMCSSKSGRETIMKLPLNKVLPETDGPFTQKSGMLYMPWDMDVINYLAEQHELSVTEIIEQMKFNLRQISIQNNIK